MSSPDVQTVDLLLKTRCKAATHPRIITPWCPDASDGPEGPDGFPLVTIGADQSGLWCVQMDLHADEAPPTLVDPKTCAALVSGLLDAALRGRLYIAPEPDGEPETLDGLDAMPIPYNLPSHLPPYEIDDTEDHGACGAFHFSPARYQSRERVGSLDLTEDPLLEAVSGFLGEHLTEEQAEGALLAIRSQAVLVKRATLDVFRRIHDRLHAENNKAA